MASEGGRREKALKLHGCNYISKGTKRSCPFAIFYRDDVLRLCLEMDAYYKEHWMDFNPDPNARVETIIPAIYGRIYKTNEGTLDTTGAKRTGCVLCGFGIHIEQRPHRFDRIRQTNPKMWENLMYKVGWGKVLDYIGVGWEDEIETVEQMHIDDIINAE